MVQRLILHFLFVFLVIVSIYEAVCTLETLKTLNLGLYWNSQTNKLIAPKIGAKSWYDELIMKSIANSLTLPAVSESKWNKM